MTQVNEKVTTMTMAFCKNAHQTLLNSMALYTRLRSKEQQAIGDFVANFYGGKSVYAHRHVNNRETLLTIVAANAALVGAAQRTHYFSTVKWIYLCVDDLPDDGDAFLTTSVRLNAELCLEESARIHPGRNLIVHEFSHVLDSLLGISGSTAALRKGYRLYIDQLQSGDDSVEASIPVPDLYGDSIEFVEPAALIDEVEFFAYISEWFFTAARQLRFHYPDLYRDLASIYGLDMAVYC